MQNSWHWRGSLANDVLRFRCVKNLPVRLVVRNCRYHLYPRANRSSHSCKFRHLAPRFSCSRAKKLKETKIQEESTGIPAMCSIHMPWRDLLHLEDILVTDDFDKTRAYGRLWRLEEKPSREELRKGPTPFDFIPFLSGHCSPVQKTRE